ncbi:MAG: GpE family phage tail protein [Stenotrophomonas koreensis]
MADVAVIFSFTLSELSAMGLEELMEWRERARSRSGAKQ